MIAVLIFEALAFSALIIQNQLIKTFVATSQTVRVLSTTKQAILCTTFVSVGITCLLLLWLGENRRYGFFEAYTATAESGQYYQYRKFVEEDVLGVTGRGTWTAKKLVLNIGPVVMVILGFYFYTFRNWGFLFLLALQGIVGILVAGVLAHKSYLLVALYSPFIALFVWSFQRYSKIAFSILFIGFTGIGAVVFQAATGLDLFGAITEFFLRIVIIPAYVAGFYFEVIPDALPFRGLFQIGYMYNSSAPVGDYAVHDVALAATGRVWGTNAHFLAVAYSGLGQFGVFLISVICIFCVWAVDVQLLKLERVHRVAAILISSPAFIGITSVSFLGSFESGFLIQPFALALLSRAYIMTDRSGRNRPASQEFQAPSPTLLNAAQ